jgi:hypothetical protein
MDACNHIAGSGRHRLRGVFLAEGPVGSGCYHRGAGGGAGEAGAMSWPELTTRDMIVFGVLGTIFLSSVIMLVLVYHSAWRRHQREQESADLNCDAQ